MRADLTLVLCLCWLSPVQAQDKKSEKRVSLADKTPEGELMKTINRSPRLASATTKLNSEVERAAKAYHRERAKSLEAYLKVIDLELNDALGKKKLDEANSLDQLKRKVEHMLADSEQPAAPAPPLANAAPPLPVGTVLVPITDVKVEPKTEQPRPEQTIPTFVRPATKKPDLNVHQIMSLVGGEHRQVGAWQMKDGALVTNGSGGTDNFFIPVTPPESYDLELKVTRMNDSKAYIAVIVPFGEKGLWLVFDQNRKRSLVDNVGKAAFVDNLLPPGEERKITVKMRKEGVVACVNDEAIFSWEGDPKDAFNPIPSYDSKPCLQVLCADKSQWKITSIEMKPPAKE